ncbi:IclR family transcriptional regulator [Actinoallomurus rhizosphaericola]|uniref:IclR family transcriptional regulator n=1 Tax=Actinoallomurus rhizosphaericola TaxID=2952536 RepID=UPI0020903636|nr:IclR family transcriptional regulator [Actinoallomurus rhizosphaericola]
MTNGSTGAQAVRRALNVLECFRDNAQAIGASDIARRLGLSSSTAHRLAQALTEAGFLERDMLTARYRLGPSVLELGLLSYHQRGLHHVLPELDHLSEVTGATVDLAMHSGRHAVLVAGGTVRRNTAGLGLRRPLHSTALGKVLLAWARPGDDDLSEVGPLRPLTDRTIVDPARLRAEIDRVRARGYALNDGESAEGVRTVAVPLLDRTGYIRFALAVRSTPDIITDARIPWLLGRARACVRALEVLLLTPDERGHADPGPTP